MAFGGLGFAVGLLVAVWKMHGDPREVFPKRCPKCRAWFMVMPDKQRLVPKGDAEATMSEEYRLSWEMVRAQYAYVTEVVNGKGCWPARFEYIPEGEWQPVLVVTTNPWDQFNTLKDWAEKREQPIRNVKLEVREVPHPDSGWLPVEAAR